MISKVCDMCGEKLSNGINMPKYCPECGQAIDWEVRKNMDDKTKVFIEYGYNAGNEAVIKALAKEIPARLETAEEFKICPRCGCKYIGENAKLDFINHCYKCGQALNWEVR